MPGWTRAASPTPFTITRLAGINQAHLEKWIKKAGWETVLNRAGTTFRKLPDAEKTGLDAEKAIALMLAHPSAIKRPVLEFGGKIPDRLPTGDL